MTVFVSCGCMCDCQTVNCMRYAGQCDCRSICTLLYRWLNDPLNFHLDCVATPVSSGWTVNSKLLSFFYGFERRMAHCLRSESHRIIYHKAFRIMSLGWSYAIGERNLSLDLWTKSKELETDGKVRRLRIFAQLFVQFADESNLIWSWLAVSST